MSKAIHKLSVKKLQALARQSPPEKLKKYFDGDGLFVAHLISGKLSFRYKFSIRGKEDTATYGLWDEMSLADAREAHKKDRLLVREGINPNYHKTFGVKADNSLFKSVAERWLSARGHLSQTTLNKDAIRLNKYLLPYFGNQTVQQIKKEHALQLLRQIENTGKLETCNRVRRLGESIFDYAVSEGLIGNNPFYRTHRVLKKPKTIHFAAVESPNEWGEIMRRITEYKGTPVVRLALLLACRTLLRSKDIREARWTDFDLVNRVWRVKTAKQGRVIHKYLSDQVIAILDELHLYSGNSNWLFPVQKSTESKSETIRAEGLTTALRRLDIPKGVMTFHGIRATSETLMIEYLKYPKELIELEQSRKISDPLGHTYDRASRFEERKAMMIDWNNYCDGVMANDDFYGWQNSYQNGSID